MTQTVTAGIVERIRRYRKLNGWTAKRLAQETGGVVSRHVIANLESGRKATLDVEELLAIAIALRLSPTVLFIDLEQPFAPAPIRFAGSSARPLDDNASNAAYAQWMNGRIGEPTSAAAARIALVGAAIDGYLSALDAAAMPVVCTDLAPDGERTRRETLRRAATRMAELGLSSAVPG